jgi:hypothetical protein
MWDANHNPADYGENYGRGTIQLFRSVDHIHIPTATACEVLARRIVHISPPERLPIIMSSRFQHRQVDGDVSDMSSALEMAIDSSWLASKTFSPRRLGLIIFSKFQHHISILQRGPTRFAQLLCPYRR